MNDHELLWATEEDRRVRRADPLAHWRCSSPGQEDYIRYVARGIEPYAHGGNGCGKSNGGGALDLAFCEGRSSLAARDGTPIPLPVIEPPVHWLLGGKSYKLRALGPVQALRDLLGDWPHEEGPIKADNCPGVFHIKHRLARNRSEWSQLFILPYEGESPEGPRVDGWRADEIPPVEFLGAFRSRMKAGRRLYGGITATPIDKREWEPVLAQFPRQVNVVENGRVRLQWSVFDNRAMPAWQLADYAQRARGDPWERARLYGDHVNVAGGCPWPADLLAQRMSRTREPLTVERVTIQAERTDAGGKHLIEVYANVKVWEKPIPGDPYYMVGDPAKGIVGGNRDPDGFLMRNRRTRSYVAELESYVGGWGLGNLMITMGKRYNNALADPLTTGGYAESLLTALRVGGYRNLTHSRIETTPGTWEDRVGTVETHEMRGKMVGAVEQMLLTDSGDIPSARAIQTLMDCIVDETGKVLAKGKKHDELLACLGRSEVYLNQWAAPKPRDLALKRYENPNVRILKAIEKRDEAIALKYAPKLGPRDRRVTRAVPVVTIEP